MFSPRFTITNGILKNLKKIEGIIAVLKNAPIPSDSLLFLENRAREVSSYSSTSIEGNPLPLTEVKKLLKNKPSELRKSEKEIINYNEALSLVYASLQEKTPTLTLPFLLTLQNTVTKDLIPEYQSGHLRKEPVFVNDPLLQKTIYWPPDHQGVPSLLKDLLEFLQREKGKIDSMLLAGIFHKHFVIIHPFVDGNGRTARLATLSLLSEENFPLLHILSLEKYYNANVSRYFKNVGVFGNYYDIAESIDYTEWLEYFTDGMLDEFLRIQKDIESIQTAQKPLLKAHHKKIVQYLQKEGIINDRIYSTLTTRAKATRALDFSFLLSAGLIKRHGKGKSTVYKLLSPDS